MAGFKVCACAHSHDLWIQWCIRVEYSSPSSSYYSQPLKVESSKKRPEIRIQCTY